MPDKSVIASLKPLHGAVNLFVMFLFLLQAVSGLSIRKARKAGGLNPRAVKKHRRTGPVIALLAAAGYSGGAVLGYLDNGRLLKYPLHFLNGTMLMMLIIATAIVSRSMTVKDSRLRNIHLAIGLIILCLYALQAFLGISILF